MELGLMLNRFKEVEKIMEELVGDSKKLAQLSGIVLLRALSLREREEIIKERYCLWI